MALTDKLTAIADAIRAKTGGTAAMTLDQMPDAILGIVTGSNPDEIPSYVKAEARRVINDVIAAQNANTITFLAMSDAHQMASESTAANIQNNNTANHHAGLAAKVIAQACDIDFAAFLGDYSWGASTTTIEDGKAEIEQINAYISEAFANIPNFRTVGNHDALLYSLSQNGNNYLKPSQLYELIGKYNEGATVDSANPKRGYCYRDFEDKKLRVICLNTAEGEETGTPSDSWKCRISGAQMAWFADAIAPTKTGTSEWSVLVLSHHPLDWGTVNPATKIIDAYVGGKTVNFTHGTATINKDYSGVNSAKFIGQIHGHVHGFRVDNLHLVNGSTVTPIDAIRVATPNACFTRANEYGENSGTDSNGIEFGETSSYEKTAGTGQDTAFVVYVIDTAAEVIHAIHYGAGYTRTIDYSSNYHKITYSLSNVTSSNMAESIEKGAAYTAVLTPATDYSFKTVTVTMGGVDVTSQVYADGTISIPSVTGNVVITASASFYVANNLLTTAKTTDGVTIYNGIGYKNGVYASEGSNQKLGNYGTDAAYWASGVIEWDVSRPLYIRGWNPTSESHSRMYISTAGYDGAISTDVGFNTGIGSSSSRFQTTIVTVTVLDESTNYVKIEAKASTLINAGTVWFTLSLPGTGDNVSIVMEEQTAATVYSVTYNLTNVTSSNTWATVSEGNPFSTYLSAESGYELDTVKVTMGGVVLQDLSGMSGGTTVAIEKVTGNVVITAVANAIPASYTNVLATAEEYGSTAIYNDVGYKDGKYLSTSSAPYEGTDSAFFLTGYIPYTPADKKPIYIKGAVWTEDSHSRMNFFKSSKAICGTYIHGGAGSASAMSTYYTVETLASNYIKLTPTSTTVSVADAPVYFRMSLKGSGDGVIIAIDEPIE